MAFRTPEEHLAWYVINYYGGFMTKPEWMVHRAFITEFTVQHGYSGGLVANARVRELLWRDAQPP